MNSLSKNLLSISTCLSCSKNFEVGRNCTGKYCTLKCQHDFQYKSWVKMWLNGEFVQSSLSISRHIKRFLFDKQNGRCMFCKNNHWNGIPIALQIDHIDGNFTNNNHDNLRLLCHNCHALTPNYKVKNKGHGRKSRSIQILDKK